MPPRLRLPRSTAAMTTRRAPLALPLALLLAASLVIWLADGDLRLARMVHASGTWPGNGHPFWEFVYAHASLPAFSLAALALVVLAAGLIVKQAAALRKPALFMVLLLAFGPGLVVNVLLKDHLGRARPIDVYEFGGDFSFSQFWQPGPFQENRSFPSGHASVAFTLVGPWFFLRRRNPLHAACWLVGGLAYGTLVGVGRILQGGHFLSDVLWAGGLVYLCGEILARIMALDRKSVAGPES